MFVPVLKKIFPKKESYFILKQNNFTKEIFSKKLGKKPNIDFNITIKETTYASAYQRTSIPNTENATGDIGFTIIAIIFPYVASVKQSNIKKQ